MILHLRLKTFLKFFAVIFAMIPMVGFGQLLLNNTSDGTSSIAVQSGAGAGQFNCGSTFADAGGTGANYTFASGDGVWTVTYCAAAGQYLSVVFSSVDVVSGGGGNTDVLTFNSGAGNVTIPEIGGGGQPSSYTVESSIGGCVTFTLTTGLSGSNTGFNSTIACVTPPANDNPCGALSMSVFSTCNYTTVSNSGAQNTSGIPAPTCGIYGGSDVWYSATVPSDGNLVLSFSQGTGTMIDAQAAVYSSSNGTCSGTFTQLACDDDSGPGLMPAITISNPALAGQTVWIRLWDFNGDFEGTFDVCATGNVGACTPTTADCLGAIPVCSNSSYTNLASGQGCVADLNSSNDGCLAGEHNMTYYLIHIGTSGTWGFDATFPVSANGIEYDWLLYQLPANPYVTPSACNLPATGPIRCSYASQAGKSEVGMGMVPGQAELTEGGSPSGDGYVHWLDAAVAGEYYLLGIDRWSTGGSAYTLSFTGTATMNCDIMVVLPIELLSFTGTSEGRNNRLNWVTSTEQNNDYFTVERSRDTENWEIVGVTNGAGNSTEELSYTMLDENPFTEITYYRLRQTDFDGENKLSNIISIASVIEGEGIFTNLMPNPSNESFYFNYAGTNFNEPIQVVIYNSAGQIVSNSEFNSFNKSQGLSISTSEIANGFYQVVISQGDKTELKRISVIHD